MEHVTAEQAVKLASGRLESEEWWRIARHLLTGCRLCRERLSALGVEERCELFPVDESAYDDVVSRAIARMTRQEVPRPSGRRATSMRRAAASAPPCPCSKASSTSCNASKDSPSSRFHPR